MSWFFIPSSLEDTPHLAHEVAALASRLVQSALQKQEWWKLQDCCHGRILLGAEREMEALTLVRVRDEGIFQKFSQRSLFDSRARKKSWECRLRSLFPKFEP